MTDKNFNDFDNYAESYRSVHSSCIKMTGADSYYFAEHKILQIKQHENEKYLKMLDVGCGDGAAEIYIEKYFPTWQVQAIDISKKSITEAQGKNIKNAFFQLYDGENIPFADGSFDVVFMAGVLHHLNFAYHDSLLKEIRRTLKPGGRLYLNEQNPLNPVTKYLVNTCEFDKDAKLLMYNYTKAILKKAGYSVVKNKFTLFFPRKGILAKLIKFEDKLSWLPLGAQYMFRCVK